MLDFKGKQIHLACGTTNMRYGIDALAAVVAGNFNLNPAIDVIFIFCNAARDRLKILQWDGNGFWLHYKRLEHGKFPWPKAGEEKTMTLSHRELEYLLGGTKLKLKLDRIDFTDACAA
jgi:transposase